MTKNFTREAILRVRDNLKTDSDGNHKFTTEDLNLVYDMLSEFLSMKHAELTLYNHCTKYFAHPNTLSKGKQRIKRKKIRECFEKMDRFLLIDKN